ncbi:MAG: prevent-host-death protein [Actinomycetes bacterium]
MSGTVHYSTLRAGREHLTDVLDAAAEGRPASVSRGKRTFATVDADRLAAYLRLVRPARAEVLAENDGWSVFIPGLPIAADGATLDEALDETVLALRDYADAWSERLRLVPNHADNWDLAHVVEFSSDDQLKVWLRGQ